MVDPRSRQVGGQSWQKDNAMQQKANITQQYEQDEHRRRAYLDDKRDREKRDKAEARHRAERDQRRKEEDAERSKRRDKERGERGG